MVAIWRTNRENGRCGGASAPQDNDGRRHHGGITADHVEQRHRLRDYAAYCRADDRRHGLFNIANADRDSSDLRIGQRGRPQEIEVKDEATVT